MMQFKLKTSFTNGGWTGIVAIAALAFTGCSSPRQSSQSQSHEQADPAGAVTSVHISFFQVPFT